MTYVTVALAKVHTSNKFYTYETSETVSIGAIVQVPFGNRIAWGVIMDMVKKPTFSTKKITKLSPFVLPASSLELMNFMFDFYPDDKGLITQLFIPSNISINPHNLEANILMGKDKPLPNPNEEQQIALKVINNKKTNRVLLHGDTGTGKTRVFLDKAKQILSSGKSVLILAPEIGLTPQLIHDFVKHLNSPIVLTHSELTPSERRRVWEYALNSQKPSVFVGPRSALFLPYKNLGMIVVDEAHDSSYKQSQSAPRYQSLHVTGKLAAIHKSLLVQSTATPNVDDYEIAKVHGYKIIRMKTQAAGVYKSNLSLVDITDRQKFTKSSYLSDQLIDATTIALNKGQQIMLFLNRRGSARLIQCSNCGWQSLCPNCGLPLIYHHDHHKIFCHSCSFKEVAPAVCPECNSIDLSFKVMGTKSLVEHTKKLFPKAKIIRFDADSTASEQLHRNIDVLKNGDVDIVIGTQLISKGIDLPKLSVVGVINADTGLNLPDFRAEEMTFQQLYQVTGRAGRGHVLSNSFIQSRVAEHPIMQAVLHRSWEDYFKYENAKRQKFDYPPKCFLAVIKIHKKTSKVAENICQKTVEELSKDKSISVLGPSPSFYEKLGSYYIWQIILKSHNRSKLVSVLRNLSNEWIIDVDPTSLL